MGLGTAPDAADRDRGQRDRAGLREGGTTGARLILVFAGNCDSLFLLRSMGHCLRGALAYFRRRRYEATLVALFFAATVWIVMHLAIVIVSTNHPNYLDPNVIVGGFMSHIFFAVPLALVVKRRLA
jgi:hypothetical protein